MILNFLSVQRGLHRPTHKMKTTKWDGRRSEDMCERVCQHPKCWLCAKWGREAGASPEGGVLIHNAWLTWSNTRNSLVWILRRMRQTEITSSTVIVIFVSLSPKLRGTKNCVWLYLPCVSEILMHYHFPILLQAGQRCLIAYFLIK